MQRLEWNVRRGKTGDWLGWTPKQEDGWLLCARPKFLVASGRLDG